MSIVVVAFVIDVLRTSDAAVGVLYGAIGVGGLVGLPLAVMVVNRTGVHGALTAGLAAWGLPLAISALSPTPIAVVALFGVIGLGNSIVDISYFAVLQRSVPDRLLSRVLGLVESMFQGGVALGAFVGAVLLDQSVRDPPSSSSAWCCRHSPSPWRLASGRSTASSTDATPRSTTCASTTTWPTSRSPPSIASRPPPSGLTTVFAPRCLRDRLGSCDERSTRRHGDGAAARREVRW